MRFGAMFSDVLRSLLRRPFTERYPSEQRKMPERARGMLHWNPEKCTGCALCVKDCPADAIEIITLDKKSGRRVLRYHVDRCTFCGQCVGSCRFDCLRLANDEWTLASATREPFTVLYGSEDDIATVLERETSTDSVPPAEG